MSKIDTKNWENRFLGLIERSIQTHWEQPAFSDYRGDTFRYKDVAMEIARLHLLFDKAGLRRGDKIALVGRNSSRWAISFFAILSYGAVAVPILNDFKPDNIHHIVNHSEAKALFVGATNWENLNEGQMPNLRFCMLIDRLEMLESRSRHAAKAWDEIDRLFDKKYPKGLTPDRLRYHLEKPNELAVLNYTSGTTSFSKGVMIPYRSLWSNTKFAADHLPFVHPGDPIVCMLPMAHMYGLAFEILNSVNKGCHVHFLTRTPSPKIITEAFNRIRPTLILAVPLIIEKIVRNRIFPELKKTPIQLALKVPFTRELVLRKIAERLLAAFGGRVGEVVIGGAALNREVETFLHRIRFPYTVGYGMTECGPLISYAQWDAFEPGSVGRVVDRMEARIDSKDPEREVGEILVRGDNVMLGYYKNPEATKATLLADGWMRTGDLGVISADGSIFIRGRSKTMILGPSGQNIYPEEIEDKLNNLPYVAESLVVARGKRLVALIYPNWELADKAGVSHDKIESIMKRNLKTLNDAMPDFCFVSSFQLYAEEFEKTPKRSIKRYLYSE